MEKKKYFTVYRMAVVGLMSALVFACTFIHIDVPVPMSNKVMIHFGNIMSLLSALLFGPVTGGFPPGWVRPFTISPIRCMRRRPGSLF